jgi:hypothetical protein
MVVKKEIYLTIVILLFLFVSLSVAADNNTTINKTNRSTLNQKSLLNGITYPHDAATISTDFSGSSLQTPPDNQSPAEVMSFVDRSLVSGFITNFVKSFHYESGTDL